MIIERMKHKIALIIWLSVFCLTIAQASDLLTVTEIKGNVTYITSQGQRLPLEVGDIVDETTVINIPFHGSLEIANQVANKKYNIKAPGRAPVSVLLKDNRNDIADITHDYVKSVLGQLTGSGAIKKELVTQPAAITRKMATYKQKGIDLSDDIGIKEAKDDTSFTDISDEEMKFTKKDLINDYLSFRKQCIQTYANYLREAWKSYSGEDPVRMPEEKEMPPMFIPVDENGNEGDPISYEQAMADGLKAEVSTPEETTNSWFSYIGKVVKTTVDKIKKKSRKGKQIPVEKVHDDAIVKKPKEVKAPVPMASVPRGGGGVNTPFHFTAFGTDFQVRISNECQFKLRSISEDAVADAVLALTDTKYDNLLYDCIKIRKDNQLSDWAYYEVLKELTEKFCGKGTNEATLLLGYIYSQSGYKLRIGRDYENNKLLLLLASQHTIYNKAGYKLDGEIFYKIDSNSRSMSLSKAAFTNEKNRSLYISEASFPNETSLSLAITKAQKFDYAQSPTRTIQAKGYPDFKVTIHTNKNLLSFYDTYLPSRINDNEMTRWAFYANTPISEDVRDELYPQLHAQLDHLSQKEAVSRLMNLIQTIPYVYDDSIWHCDRAFFPEESLYYEGCDCEDRAILLSRLVRDILGLKTILIYYPGHLAMGICFTEPVKGDTISYRGKEYLVCDATYFFADPGKTMPECDNNKAQVILLE